PPAPRSTLFPYTTLFRSIALHQAMRTNDDIDRSILQPGQDVSLLFWRAKPGKHFDADRKCRQALLECGEVLQGKHRGRHEDRYLDRKSTRLNSSHVKISY